MARACAWARCILSRAGRLLPVLYATEQSYGWSVGMRAITHAILRGQWPLPDGPLLELGCGGGTLLAEISVRHLGRRLLGVDLHPLALTYAQRRLADSALLSQSDLQSLPFADDSVAVILALDALDQRDVDLASGLAESWRILLPGGMLLLRVSAHPWLEGGHDEAVASIRRLKALARDTGAWIWPNHDMNFYRSLQPFPLAYE